MKFQPERFDSDWVVQGYDANGVVINGTKHQHSVVFGSGLAPTEWKEVASAALGIEAVEWLHGQCPAQTEVVLVGTGKQQVFPSIEVRRFFAQKQLPVEYMDTQAACRTYNILVGEGRQVVAALIV